MYGKHTTSALPPVVEGLFVQYACSNSCGCGTCQRCFFRQQVLDVLCGVGVLYDPRRVCLQDLLQHGEAKRYRHVLREHMQGLLPPNAYQLCSSGSSSSRAFSSSSSSSSLGGCCGSSHPRYHIVTSRQAVQPVTSGCSGGSGGNPAGTHTGGASNNKTDSNSSSSTGGQPAANHEAPAGQQQQQQVGVGSAGHSSGSNGSNAPCVLGATRVRACCSGCLQPDVFMGESLNTHSASAAAACMLAAACTYVHSQCTVCQPSSTCNLQGAPVGLGCSGVALAQEKKMMYGVLIQSLW